MKEAFLYEKRDGERVRCRLCSHYCLIEPGDKGTCRVRENRAGTLYSLIYGRVIAQNIDPIEKKPLFHYLPGSLSYSIAAVGCNFACAHCQNADISQMPRDRGAIMGGRAEPEAIVAAARHSRCATISYTYTEPTVFAEYVFDTGLAAHRAGIKNVIVSNGYQSPEAVEKLGPIIDAANIDLKSFSDDFYRDICQARLKPVLKTLKGLKNHGVWLEVTTLLIPGLNDSAAELKSLAEWLVGELGPETPWHVSRFHPTYRMTDRGVTPAASLSRAYDIGREAGLAYVYLGNVPGQGGETTYCPDCRATLIDRLGFTVRRNRLQNGACPDCGRKIAGVF